MTDRRNSELCSLMLLDIIEYNYLNGRPDKANLITTGNYCSYVYFRQNTLVNINLVNKK